jgi:hypothetical protein
MINSIYLICSDTDTTQDVSFHGVFHSLREVDEFFYDKMLRPVQPSWTVHTPQQSWGVRDRVDDDRARLYGWAVRSVRDINVGRYVTVASVRGRWFHIYRYLPNDVSRTIHFAVTKDLSEPAGLVDFHTFSERYEDAVDSVPNCYDDLGGEVTHIAEIFNFTLP